MASRQDLPRNREADEMAEVRRQVIFEYLRDKATREERKEILKEAWTEWLDKKATELGWLSFRMIFYAVVGYLLYGYLTANGWVHKP